MFESVDEIDFHAMDEAMARFRRGELREGLLWLGRARERLEPALRLYDAEWLALTKVEDNGDVRRAA